MTEERELARPRQVTTAVVMAGVASLVLVISLFDTLGRLRTPETRAAIDEVLGKPPGDGLGLDTAQVIEMMRVLAFASGALAAMTAVFAVFVWQRHRGARIGLTVAAALLVLTAPVAGLLPFFVAVGAALVWSRAGRDWYAGRLPAPVPASGAVPRSGPAWGPAPGSTPGEALSEQGPPPAPYPFGGAGPSRPQQPPQQQPQQPPQQSPQQQPWPPGPPHQPYGALGQPPQVFPMVPGYPFGGPVRDPDRRPVTVTIAAILTWIGAGAVTLAMLAFMGVLATSSDAFVREFDKAASGTSVSLSRDEVMAAGWAVAAVFLFWSLASVVLAVLAFRRSNAGRITLAVSSVVCTLLSLVTVTSLVSIPILLMAGASTALLFTGGANDWYSRRGGTPPPSEQQAPAPTQPLEQPPGRHKPW